MKIYCIGNPHLRSDSLQFRIADRLTAKMQKEGIEFVKCYSPDKIDFENEQKIIILDVVKDTKEIVFIRDIERLKNYPSLSCHDLDLGFHLQLLKKTGKLEGKEVFIIGIPENIDIRLIEQNRTLFDFLPKN